MAQDNNPLYFPETHKSVQGDFLRYWRSLREPLAILGYPITNELTDSITRRPTQYFQRGRLDQVMTDHGLVVQPAALGRLLYDHNPDFQANTPDTGPTCRLFAASGIRVCYAFLQYYDQNDGPRNFGEPVSGMEMRDGNIVQYFERVRLEWRTTRPPGQRVVVGQLGRLALDKYGPNLSTSSESPIPVHIPSSEISKITALAFVGQAFLPAQSQQTVYVIVQDQDLNPVKDAQVSINVIYPDGTRYPIRSFEVTSVDGVFKVSFPVGVFPVKQVVQIEVTAELQDLKASATTWFRIWY